MAELFSVNLVLFLSAICNWAIFIGTSETREKTTPDLLTLIGLLVILKDINVIPCRYKIHNWMTWLPLEVILCLAMTEFVIHVIWYRIEEMVEVFVKQVLLENDTTLYVDAGGDSLVNFILMVLSGGFLVYAVCITNTHVIHMDTIEEKINWIRFKFNSLYERFTAVKFENMREPQPEERVVPNEEPVQEAFSSPPQPMQCITICAPGLLERCGDGPTENAVYPRN